MVWKTSILKKTGHINQLQYVDLIQTNFTKIMVFLIQLEHGLDI